MRLITTIAAIAALVLTGPSAAAQGYSPPGSITVTPPTPAPGEVITVAVTGCEAGTGTVQVFVDRVFVGTAEVIDGSFSQDFVVPLEAQGAVDVEVFCDDAVLASIIDVQVGPLAFEQPVLPRTGSEVTTLARIGMGLVGVGLVATVGARRRERSDYEPAHGATGTGAER
ncbi:MAG: hypothetical protein AAF480_02285 [Actinomycetota bacterium]